jgi:hypothetical protein
MRKARTLNIRLSPAKATRPSSRWSKKNLVIG